jgi:glycosyltransferase involved in cell wall biosynthesis
MEYHVMDDEIDVSVVTTACNEASNVAEFLRRTTEAFEALQVSGEIVFVDDASIDGTLAEAQSFKSGNPSVRLHLIRHSTQQGIVRAIVEGTALAAGRLVCYLPADLESLPDTDIPTLFRAMDCQTDVVVGWRQDRQDGKSAASKVYNVVNRFLFGVTVHDANWIKLVRREKMDGLVLMTDWQSIFVGLLAARGCRVREVPTQWHRRKAGKSKFGWGRFPRAVVAAISAKAYVAFGSRPLLLFVQASALFFLAALVAVVLALSLVAGEHTIPVMLLAVAFLVLSGISASVGMAVEAIRWQNSHSQIQLQTGQLGFTK